jgi:hypothetical protein
MANDSNPGIQPKGATNNGNLLIPNKTMANITQPGYGTDMRAIERWANSLNASDKLYASLTGAGQTATPGDLDQEGGLVVHSGSSSSTGIFLQDNGSHGISIRTFTSLIQLFSSVGSIQLQAASAGISIIAGNLTLGGAGGIAPHQLLDIVTTDTVVNLLTTSPPRPAFGFIATGHIYFWNVATWTLLI